MVIIPPKCMEDYHYNRGFRTEAFSILDSVFQQNITHRGRFAVNTLVGQLGITQDQAKELLSEYSLAKAINEFPGNVRELPSFDSESKPTNTGSYEDELRRRSAWFALGYVEDATERDDNSALFNGQYWLGNTDEETIELVGKMQENPAGVVSYIRWAFQNDPSLDNMLEEFSTRAREGTLRPPSLE